MTNSQASSSEPHDVSISFDLLSLEIRRWIWDQNWNELRDIQEHAIRSVLREPADIIISAATASGKTEAAFLPICSLIAGEKQSSFGVLYVSPLKALINDQFGRLEDLCARLDIPVTKWHGDVPANVKHKAIRNPRGILLTTPESLEAICIVHGPDIARVFRDLSFIVVDELHAFIGTERGKQLQSLLNRVDRATGRSPKRIGLSATIGDLSLAAAHLRSDAPDDVEIIQSLDSHQELRAQIRGYLEPAIIPDHKSDTAAEDDANENGEGESLQLANCERAIATHLFNTLRNENNLIFANSRANVEKYTALLCGMCEDARVPVNFFPHHGNLSRDIREDVEAMLKAGDQPVNVVCTSTLELGIDIGAMDSVAQIGAPPSVSSLRQRMGRSGRRGQAAVIRMYVSEAEITPATSILDCLRISLVQSIAVLSLLIEGWCEPPAGDAMHLSTMVQQVLSVIAQYGGAGAPFLYSLLCQSGPFKSVTKAQFATFLHGLADHELISQTSDGTIMLGGRGESLVNHYSFYAAFSTPEEYRVFHKGKLLGSLPVDSQVIPGSYLIFAGRRWRIEDVDAERKVIDLSPSKGGRVPIFTGNGPIVHDRVRVKMVEIYQGDWVPEFLDRPARQMLCEAREAYARFELATTPLIRSGADTYVFHWAGDRVGRTLALVLAFNGIKAMDAGPALLAPDSDKSQIARALAAEPVDNPLLLMEFVPGARIEKFDRYVDKDLLAEGYVSRMLDLPGACQAARRITEMLERPHTSAP